MNGILFHSHCSLSRAHDVLTPGSCRASPLHNPSSTGNVARLPVGHLRVVLRVEAQGKPAQFSRRISPYYRQRRAAAFSSAEPSTETKAQTNTTWQRCYNELEAFHKDNGHSSLLSERGTELEEWVRAQRTARKEGRLKAKQINALNSLEFDWEGGAAEWMSHYQQLTTFCNTHGSCNVPKSYPNGELGEWLSEQRAAQRKGRLSAFRAGKLEALGITPKKK
ncbi:hypothetical protein CYMTET_8438 [Cymbomonas tetramitiformis]|uniref:Helicase-associated domain-containing protein n=1 Tax=Cymbomonas tetramitiformis TaxID=36881 RepID=A0AAE0GT56_9CHLO|nr:hypothetical protein CYMTET_8438 [Cymbomonas tetramitiformis]